MSEATAPKLQVEGVTKQFGGLVAVNDVSFAVEAGEALGIIGPNGAGKTTLYHLISGFEAPTHGRVRFDGRDITHLPPHERARAGLVRTFQVVRPFPGLTVLENLMVGGLSDSVLDTGAELGAARARAVEVARRIGLEQWLHREAHTLPYGSLKRLEVGRAMMLRPSVLLLDEPFAGLAANEAESLAGVAGELSRSGITLVVIEHKLGILMRLVRRVVVLNFGQLIADGTPAAIAADAAVQEAYLGASGEKRFA